VNVPQTIYWIMAAQPYRLAIVARPRGNDWLSDEIEDLSQKGVGVLVSLLTPDETEELGLLDEQRFCQEFKIQFFNFPIPDRSVPDERGLRDLLERLIEQVHLGRGVGFHCRAGIGRSSMLAAMVLARLGWTSEAAFLAISESRGCKVPDTIEQEQWVNNIVLKLSS
jgi:protein-tyrosine phosphatase